MSNMMHKVKEALSGHHGDSHKTDHGPHDSKAANKLDPRVDSDRGTFTGRNNGKRSGLTLLLVRQPCSP